LAISKLLGNAHFAATVQNVLDGILSRVGLQEPKRKVAPEQVESQVSPVHVAAGQEAPEQVESQVSPVHVAAGQVAPEQVESQVSPVHVAAGQVAPEQVESQVEPIS
jgi:hypothetical protein